MTQSGHDPIRSTSDWCNDHSAQTTNKGYLLNTLILFFIEVGVWIHLYNLNMMRSSQFLLSVHLPSARGNKVPHCVYYVVPSFATLHIWMPPAFDYIWANCDLQLANHSGKLFSYSFIVPILLRKCQQPLHAFLLAQPRNNLCPSLSVPVQNLQSSNT